MTFGRFSTGIEQHPDSPDNRQVGTFATGIASAAPLRVGRFSTGIERDADSPANRRIGSYAAGANRPLADPVRVTQEWKLPATAHRAA
jgi:hypothetical protein